jgi:hypothetical protein
MSNGEKLRLVPRCSTRTVGADMSRYKLWLVALATVPLLVFSMWSESLNAQQASSRPSGYGGPFISNPKAQSPEEREREIRIREEFCRAHPPGACMPDDHPPVPVNVDRRAYIPPTEPGHTAPLVTTTCRPDTKNPAAPAICTSCRENPANPEKPLCVQLIRGQGVRIPQLPLSASGAE